MKYILLVVALLIPQLASSQTAFVLNDSQWLSIIDSTADAALEGGMAGMTLAYEVYNGQDTTNKTLLEKITLVRWHYRLSNNWYIGLHFISNSCRLFYFCFT